MDTKWVAIMAMVVFTAMFVPLTVKEYFNGQCRVEAVKSNLTAEETKKVCN